MKSLFSFLPVLLLMWPGRAVCADDALAALAAESRSAALKFSYPAKLGELNSYGAFISEDGLAIVNLGCISLDRKPTVATADGTPLRFGTILGLFPEQELALMKFKHRPKQWLRIAPKEPEVGEDIVFLPIDADDMRAEKIPPLVAPVMSKRTGTTSTSRLFRFTRVLSLMARQTVEQRRHVGVGCFAVNRVGDLVGFTNGSDQYRIFLVPVDVLADDIDAMVKAEEEIPFPLADASNTFDTAVVDSEFTEYHQAVKRGDGDAVRRHLKNLLERYPDSPKLKATAAADPTLFDDPMKLFPPPDPADPAGHKVQQLLSRSTLLASREHDNEGAISELEAALALSPDDFPTVRLRLALLYMVLNRFGEAEPQLRKAYAVAGEDLSILAVYHQLLLRQDKPDEAAKLMVRVEELKAIIQPQSTTSTDPQAVPGPGGKKRPGLPGAEARLAELAASKRGAALKLIHSVAADLPGASSYGVFISADGLALVNLITLGGSEPPSADTADGTPLEFGDILGIFPDQELALVKFDHRPKVWLRLAAEEPAVGAAVAILPLDGSQRYESLENRPLPPVVGKVMAKRSELTGILRLSRFTPIISVGAGISRQQQAFLIVGSFAIDFRGDLVALAFGFGKYESQLIPHLSPVVSLAEQISELATAGKVVPFPLPPASNPLDPAVLESDFARMNDAIARGDRDLAQGLYRQLLQRHPASSLLKKRNASLGEFDKPPFGLADCPSPNPDDPAGQQVAQLMRRARTPHPLLQSDFARAVAEYQQAIALSPEDFVDGRLRLADLFITMRRYDDAEPLFREALPFFPESIYFQQQFRLLLIQQGKIEESRGVGKRVAELREIYRRP